MTKEIQRQDAIVQLLIADVRERYYASREAAREARKGEGKLERMK